MEGAEEIMYEGFIIVLKEKDGMWEAGFPKNFPMYREKMKEEAVGKMKKMIDGLHPAVKNAYKKHGDVMRELEDM